MVAASVSGRQDRNLNQMALRSLNLCVFQSSGAYEQSRLRAPVSSLLRHDQGKETRVAYEVLNFFFQVGASVTHHQPCRGGKERRDRMRERKEKERNVFVLSSKSLLRSVLKKMYRRNFVKYSVMKGLSYLFIHFSVLMDIHKA